PLAENARHFGEFIRWARSRRGWNKREFAELVGTSPKTITNTERRQELGRVNDVTVSGMARAFGVDEKELLTAWKDQATAERLFPEAVDGAKAFTADDAAVALIWLAHREDSEIRRAVR